MMFRKKKKEKQISKIALVFENCEVSYLGIEQIRVLHILNVYNAITIIGSELRSKKDLYADKIILWVDKEVLEKKISGGFGIEEYQTTLFDRLKANDLSHIDLMYDDGSNDYICVWKGYKEYINQGQTIHEENGSVRIMVEDYINKEESLNE